jgi:V8-like Glu-specific endopeptidase
VNPALAAPTGLAAAGGDGLISVDWTDTLQQDATAYAAAAVDSSGQMTAARSFTCGACAEGSVESLSNGSTYDVRVATLYASGEQGPYASTGSTTVGLVTGTATEAGACNAVAGTADECSTDANQGLSATTAFMPVQLTGTSSTAATLTSSEGTPAAVPASSSQTQASAYANADFAAASTEPEMSFVTNTSEVQDPGERYHVPLSDQDDMPWAANVSLSGRFEATAKHSAKNFSCSGTLIYSDTVLTAGHCVYNRPRGQFATSVQVFVTEDSPAPQCGYRNLYVQADYIKSGADQSDMGAIKLKACQLADGSKVGQNLGNYFGWLGFWCNCGDDAKTPRSVRMTGFPGEPFVNSYPRMMTGFAKVDGGPGGTYTADPYLAVWHGDSGAGIVPRSGTHTNRVIGVAAGIACSPYYRCWDPGEQSFFKRINKVDVPMIKSWVLADG